MSEDVRMTEHEVGQAAGQARDVGSAAGGSSLNGEASPTVFYACKYTPVELLAGFGATCQLAEHGPASSFDTADELMSANICGYAKGLLERLLASDAREIVLVTCCDAVRRVYDVLKARKKGGFLYLLDVPHKRGKADVARFRSSLARLAESYAAYSGRSFDAGAALAAFEPERPLAQEHVSVLGAHASDSLLASIRQELALPVENATCTARHLLQSPPPALARAASPDCGERCEADGAAVPGDAGRAGASLDAFLDWYAPVLLGQMPCMRMDDVGARSGLLAEPRQQGVVYHTMKFCDYYGFEYAGLDGGKDLPLVKIETDGTTQSAGQLQTRLEAFGETLQGARSADAAAAHAAGVPHTTRVAHDGGTYVLGVDSGSTSTDAVILDAGRNVVASRIIATGAKATDSARRAKEAVLADAGLAEDELAYKVATGYGRNAIPDMDTAITEITCHARGAHYLMPDVRAVIDIGGQDSKVIHLSSTGEVLNFVMNDKCAAGTGRFLEMMARTLEMPLEDFCRTGLSWKHEVKISSMCTVFAESEVVSLVAEDTPVPDIIHGLDESVARKTATLARRVDAEAPYLMTGGVARNEGVVKALEDVLGSPVATHPDSQLCGALGAALLGLEAVER